jgi:hypothetical protein
MTQQFNRKELNKLKDIALSDKQLMKLIDSCANLVLYPDVHKYKNVDDLLGKYGACVLLYESKKNYGHWVCCFKLNDREIEFFNSYGDITPFAGFPDAALQYIPAHFRDESNQDHTYLGDLLYNSQYDLSYNQYKFQKLDSNIKTCGRHVVCRLWLRSLPLTKYTDVLKKWCLSFDCDYDDVVTIWTSNGKLYQ